MIRGLKVEGSQSTFKYSRNNRQPAVWLLMDDGWMMDGRIMNGQMMDCCIDGWWMNGRMDDGRMDDGWWMNGWMMDGWCHSCGIMWAGLPCLRLMSDLKCAGQLKCRGWGAERILHEMRSLLSVLRLHAHCRSVQPEHCTHSLHPKAHLRASGWNLKKKTWVSKYCDLQMFRQPVVSLCAQRSTYSCVWLSAAQMFVFAAAAQRHAGKGWRKIWWKCPD